MELAPIAEALSSFARFRVQRYTILLIYKLAAIKKLHFGEAKDKKRRGAHRRIGMPHDLSHRKV